MLFFFSEIATPKLLAVLPKCKKVLATLCILLPVLAQAQAGMVRTDSWGRYAIEHAFFADDTRGHLNVWPLNQRDLPQPLSGQAYTDTLSTGRFQPQAPLVSSDSSNKWVLGINPILDLAIGGSNRAGLQYLTAGGLQANLRGGEKFTLFAEIFGGVERAPEYIHRFADSLGVLPGLGRNRGSGEMLAFMMPTLAMSYAPSKYFQFDLGFGKHHFGSGYRSLMLSEAAYNYPYLRISTDVWHFKYVNLFSALTHIGDEAVRSDNFQPKYMASHFLSWALSRRITFSVFESVIWQGEDSLTSRSFDPNYLNPVIFYRPVEFAMGSPDRVLIGADLSVRLGTKSQVYGQVVFDEFLLEYLRERTGWWANKWGVQVGAKTYDAFGIMGLRLQAEYNVGRPFIYSHGSVIQNYAHFNQPLAHPLGSNFREFIFMANYTNGPWFAESHSVASRFGRDIDEANLGGDLFRSYQNPAFIFGNTIGQGLRHDVLFQRLTVGRIVHKSMGLRLALRYTYRSEWVGQREADSEHFFGLHLSTGFHNQQRDF